MFDFNISAFGRIISAGALICGLATWAILATGLCYCHFFVPDVMPNPKAVLSVRTARQLVITLAGACLSLTGLSLSLFALLIGQRTVWTWTALGTNAAFWVIFGVIMSLYG